jgi:hypothetical protein
MINHSQNDLRNPGIEPGSPGSQSNALNIDGNVSCVNCTCAEITTPWLISLNKSNKNVLVAANKTGSGGLSD